MPTYKGKYHCSASKFYMALMTRSLFANLTKWFIFTLVLPVK